MLKITDTKVYGLEESIIASGYPKNAQLELPVYKEDVITENDINRIRKLASCKLGTGHDSALKGIIVQANVRFPLYWLKQFQRYHFVDIVSSSSTMHCILEMDIDEHCNEFVDEEVINSVKRWIRLYNNFDREVQRLKDIATNSGGVLFEDVFNLYPQDQVRVSMLKGGVPEKVWMKKEEIYMHIISNIPSGFELSMRIVLNYLQAKTIYAQRKNHKLPDWKIFCDWILELPMFKELVLGEGKDD